MPLAAATTDGALAVAEALRLELRALATRVVALEGEVAELRALVERGPEHRHGATRLRATDRDLLEAIAAHVGPGLVFNARELWQHGERLDDALRSAVAAAGIRDTRGLGRRLQRLARHARGPVRLACVGRDADGKWWTVTVHRQD